jgi:hypothetical protein
MRLSGPLHNQGKKLSSGTITATFTVRSLLHRSDKTTDLIIYKTKIMSRHKGKPSGINKPEGGTGTPSDFKPENLEKDEKLTHDYTDDDEKISGNVHIKNPNRNVDKPKPTNAHGYKN